jgi:hypothetical protein
MNLPNSNKNTSQLRQGDTMNLPNSNKNTSLTVIQVICYVATIIHDLPGKMARFSSVDSARSGAGLGDNQGEPCGEERVGVVLSYRAGFVFVRLRLYLLRNDLRRIHEVYQ